MAEILNVWQILGKFFNVELKKEIATVLGADSKTQTDSQADRHIWSLHKGELIKANVNVLHIGMYYIKLPWGNKYLIYYDIYKIIFPMTGPKILIDISLYFWADLATIFFITFCWMFSFFSAKLHEVSKMRACLFRTDCLNSRFG